ELAPAAWLGLIALTSLAATAAVWFIALQTFVLRRFCIYCTIAHLAVLAAAAILVHRISIEHMTPPIILAALTGFAGAIVLALLQLLIRPELAHFNPTPPIAAPRIAAPPPPPEPSPTPPPTQS